MGQGVDSARLAICSSLLAGLIVVVVEGVHECELSLTDMGWSYRYLCVYAERIRVTCHETIIGSYTACSRQVTEEMHQKRI